MMEYWKNGILETRVSIILLSGILVVSGCFTSSRISNQNLSYLYWKESGNLHPRFTVFHISDTISRLYYFINSKELLYSRENAQHEFTASFTIAYKLYPSLESKELLDSGSLSMVVPVYKNPDFIGNRSANAPDYSYKPISKTGKDIINHIEFKAGFPNAYLLEAIVSDIKRNQTARTFINIDKQNKYSRQNFLIESQAKGSPVFGNNFTAGEDFTIRCNNPDVSKLFVRYYKMPRFSGVAFPPFSVQVQKPFSYEQDSAFVLRLSDSGRTSFTLQKEGIYHFQTDTVIKEGLTLFSYYDDFPKVRTVEQLIGPLRYITTLQEYEEMTRPPQANKKIVIDNFWLMATGNTDRGKQLIREFYNRVQDANEYFTSYLEGWKTDRGMLYIVYGPPDIVYKTSGSENWVYGEEGNLMSLHFAFAKVNNPFTDNDYILNRTPTYKSSWYMAVEAWRQGIVY